MPTNLSDVRTAVKKIQTAIKNRGHRPGHLILVLAEPDNPILGVDDEMNLEDVHRLLQVGLRSPPELDNPDMLRNEILAILRALALPQMFALVVHDRHEGTYATLTYNCPLLPTLGEGMFQIGRLVGALDHQHRSAQRVTTGTPPASAPPTTKVTAKPKRWFSGWLGR